MVPASLYYAKRARSMVNVITFILVPFLPSYNSLLLMRITRLEKRE